MALLVTLVLLPVTLRAQATCPTPYLVQPGEGWFKIANKCGVPYPALRDANRELWQRQGEMLYAGDQLQMPQFPSPTSTPGSTPSPVPNATPTATPTRRDPKPTRDSAFLLVGGGIEGLRRGDLHAAYAYLGPQLQRALPFPTFSAGFAATKEITIESIVTIQEARSKRSSMPSSSRRNKRHPAGNIGVSAIVIPSC